MTNGKKRDLWATRGFSLAARLEFYSAPEPNTGCFLWFGQMDKGGYGQIHWRGRNIRAHRAAWISANGPVPPGLCVCHRCDVPSCVNEAHLWLGTNAENTADKTIKGRAARHLGERNHFAKLTQQQADAIRSMTGTQEAIAAQFGVNRTVVGKIKRGEIWRVEPVLAAILMRGR